MSQTYRQNRWFHSFDAEGIVSRQGYLLARLDRRHFLAQFYEWLTGAPSTQGIVSLDQMATEGWQFYPTDEAMRAWYQTQGLPPLRAAIHRDIAGGEIH